MKALILFAILAFAIIGIISTVLFFVKKTGKDKCKKVQ